MYAPYFRRLTGASAMLGMCLGVTAAATAADGGKFLSAVSLGNIVNGRLENNEVAGYPSFNISGVACAPGSDDKSGGTASWRTCVVIDDEGATAQAAILDGGTLISTALRIPLIKDKWQKNDIFGEVPNNINCRKKSDKKDLESTNLDGEGVAYADGYFYIIGSHGCGRNNGKFTPSSFITVRFQLSEEGEINNLAATYRLSDALANADPVKAYFATTLENAKNAGDPRVRGLNVEGVAVADGMLYAGLRAPSLDGAAYIVAAPLEALFAPGSKGLKVAPSVMALPLGDGVGIRDLSVLPDGKTLAILTGPTGENPATPYDVYLRGVAKDAKLRRVGRIPPNAASQANDKAEAILPLNADGTEMMILFDGRANGNATIYRATAE